MKLKLAALFIAPIIAFGASPLDGTWKFNPQKSQLPTKPQAYELTNGTYKCTTCVPAISVKADGKDQPITGDPYEDTIAVKVVDAHTIEITGRKGDRSATTTNTVSADGAHMTSKFSGRLTGDQVETGTTQLTRVDKGPAGSHAISGSWKTEKVENLSANSVNTTIKTMADSITMSTDNNDWGYTATFDGKEAKPKGDPGWDAVSVKRISANSVEETDKFAGKVIWVGRYTVSADGKTLSVDWSDKKHGTSGVSVSDKQ